ncbi:ATPase family AAA domain containing protein [Naviculisporaceae sp. PSN 640]
MCSLAVLNMPEDVSPPEKTSRQPLHPFFTPNRGNTPLSAKKNGEKEAESPDNTTQPPSVSSDGKPVDDGLEKPSGRQAKRRKISPEEIDGEVVKKARGRKKSKLAADAGSPLHGTLVSGQRIAVVAERVQPAEPSAPVILTNAPADESNAEYDKTIPNPDGNIDRLSANFPNASAKSEAAPKPTKMLFFNPKTGTIGSPPKPKQPKPEIEKGTPKKGKPTARIVTMTYGSDSESRRRIGELINAVLDSEPPAPPPIASRANSPPEAPKVNIPQPPRTTHPFFLGKPKKADVSVPMEEPKGEELDPPVAPKRPKLFTSTPCSPKKPRADAPPTRMPQFGTKNPALKFPGLRLPAWPWKDMVHVRGDEGGAADVQGVSLSLSSRKSKGNSVKVSSFDSVIDLLTRQLQVPALAEAVRNVNTDEFLPAPAELRLPKKHFESGTKLQARIIPELRTFVSPSQSKKGRQSRAPADETQTTPQPPPQLARLFSMIRAGLSAFDMSQCENANWTQKYAPTSAVEVLQPGNEAFLLRDWLQALMVQSVDTGSTEADKSKSSKGKSADAGKKKRRKKLDGFIVSSGDEDYELEEVSDGEQDQDWSTNGSRGVVRKTVVRSGDLSKMRDGVKIANALIISGPHGCGKTAAVYAVAKELDFEVFEINPGSRRSGKDILDKIGDMTRNHLVQQHRSPTQGDDAEVTGTDDELAKDIKSGKQATMNAFFKPKSAPAKSKGTTKPPASVKPKESKKATKKESSGNQRQSLILLEEVDILYAEDKQFWATVMELIGQSRRPFIMTCNDETLLPVQTLRLHGIFRLSPPPRDLSIDRLLLIAASEGHVLTREAVETLYESRSQDLRAATMDLQYWCQIGVGDRRGGFEWFYPRWPKGIDLDENKEVVRVVSEGTYQTGMSWLGRDTIVDPKASPRMVEEELLQQTWESWGLDMGRWQDSTGLSSWATSVSPATASKDGRLGLLESFGCLSDALSVADVCSFRSFATFKEELLDTTLPEMSEKTREDFVLGFSLLDTPLVSHYDSLLTSLPSTVKSLAKSTLQEHTKTIETQADGQLRPLDESKVIAYINSSFKSPPPGTAQVTRLDFAFAFDPISEPDPSPAQPTSYLDPSVFDRNFEPIILDVAPYVRGIVAYDSRLQKQRLKLSSLVSQGGKAGQGSKRMRTTRAALSALEGGSRSTTRGEKWFKADINPYYVMKTAGQGWDGCQEEEEEVTPAVSSRGCSSPESSPPRPVKKPTGTGRRRGRPKKVVIEDESGDELGNEADM